MEAAVDSSKRRQKIAVCLAEGHPLAAHYIGMILECRPALEVVQCGDMFPDEAVLQKRPSLLVIDANELPVPLAVYLRTVRRGFTDGQILVIGKPIPAEEMCRLLFLGVGGFVTYDKVEEQVCAAVDALLGGHVWIPPEVLERYVRLSSRLANQKGGGHGLFTPRESVTLGLLQRRLSNKEIGCILGISERTVRFHLQNIFGKLGVRDRYSVAALAGHGDLVEMRLTGRTDVLGT